MIIDGDLSGDNPALTADVVIIGAGTMGLLLATQLAATGTSVVVIEAGDRVATTAANDLTHSAGRAHGGTRAGRANGLGGTSTLWGGQLVEFDAEDFDRSYCAWPLARTDVVPWYQAVYRRFGLDVGDAVAYRDRFGREPATASDGGVERFFTHWLPEPNLARLYGRELHDSPNVRVVLKATCYGIDFAGDRATGVRVRVAGKEATVTGRRFVFAAGVIATCRFFLSTARAGGVPWAGNTNLGAFFQDHLAGNVARVTLTDERRFRDYFENGWFAGLKIQPKLRFSPTARAAEDRGAVGISGNFVFGSDLGEHITNLKHLVRSVRTAAGLSRMRQLPANLWAVGSSFAPLVRRYLGDRRIMAFFDSSLEFAVQCEQLPVRDSRVRLADEPPLADGLVRASVDWRVDGREIARIADFTAAADAYLRAAGIGELVVDPRLVARDRAMLDAMHDTYHMCGGMVMGTSAATGVVDRDLRVFGTANVHVAGTAVFPSSSHANCTLTGLALTARLGAHLRSGT